MANSARKSKERGAPRRPKVPVSSGEFLKTSAPEGLGRVLVVDDNEEVLRAEVRLLTSRGFDVSCCSDGAQALRLIRREQFDAVITDISMPHLDGIQLLRAIRSRDAALPVIMVTGEATVATAIEAVDHGAFKYLLKPVRFEELAESTKKAVQLQRLDRAKREAFGMLEKLEAPERAGLADRFESALSSLWPAFQPIVSADSGLLFGFEALLRTDEPSMPHPECLLDAAEHLGQLRRLGRAMRTAAAHGLEALDGSAHIFVNLHPEDLNDPDLLEVTSDIAANAQRIVLEITERMALDAVPNVREKVALLREMGFRIAIDDLGAGYAGLNSFVSLEPEFVKLDMSLTRGIERCRIRQKLVGSVTSVCREMGMIVVAEGIETRHERDALVELDCDLLQGYYFGRPSRMPPPRND